MSAGLSPPGPRARFLAEGYASAGVPARFIGSPSPSIVALSTIPSWLDTILASRRCEPIRDSSNGWKPYVNAG